MMSGIWTIFRKELVDTFRDRKTFIFMLLVPTILTPALIFGLGSLALSILRQNALEPVVIAADPVTQTRYRQLVHDQFLRSDVGKAIRFARSPLFAYFFSRGPVNKLLKSVPPAALKDPVAFEKWVRSMTDSAHEGLTGEVELGGPYDTISEFHANRSPAEQEMMDTVGNALFDFYALTVRGLGLVKFVDPSTLPDVPAGAPPNLPPAVAGHPAGARIYAALQDRRIHGYLEIPQDLSALPRDKDATAEITFFYDSTIALSDEANSRIHGVIDRASSGIVRARTAEQGLTSRFLNPLQMKKGTNVASRAQITIAALGGILPYMVLTFAFLGAIYPAIDLGAGEKERNTLETLLLSPVSRTEIAIGKFLLIFTSSLTAALLGVASMIISFNYLVPEAILQQLEFRVDLFNAFCIGLLSIPPAAAFAGMFLAISIFARSFKEAQNYLSPMGFVMILPAMAGMIPGLEMKWKHALIPLVNVSMLSKEFMKGSVNWTFYGLTIASCVTLAALCLAYCVYQFRREEVLFRT